MSDNTSLERVRPSHQALGITRLTRQAHALSAHASDLLQSSSCTPATLHAALQAYQDAALFFERSAAEIGSDESAKRTLQLLTTQNRKQAREVERRLNQATQNVRAQSSNTAMNQTVQGRKEAPRRNSSPVPSREPSGLGLGAIARQAWPPPGVGKSCSVSLDWRCMVANAV